MTPVPARPRNPVRHSSCQLLGDVPRKHSETVSSRGHSLCLLSWPSGGDRAWERTGRLRWVSEGVPALLCSESSQILDPGALAQVLQGLLTVSSGAECPVLGACSPGEGRESPWGTCTHP